MKVKVKVANSSSKKTREKIKKAFALLLKQKGELNKVTVTDLVKTADITRGSFYTHYDNIYDVAKDILASNTPILFTNNLAKIIDKNLYNVLNKKNIKNLELNISLFVDGCINLLIKYFKKEINYSLDDIGSYMQDTFKILFLNN